MNKETRQFMWGFFLLIIGCIGLVIRIESVILGQEQFWYNWVFALFHLWNTVSGASYISKAID